MIMAAEGGDDAGVSPLLTSELVAGIRFTPAAGSAGCGVPVQSVQRLVVVLGWWRSNDRHLRKYSEWWARRGWASVRVNGTTAVTLSSAACDSVAASVSKCAARLVSPTGRVIFHSFSNAGCILYASCVHKLAPVAPVVATIFDSCPGQLTASVGVRSALASMPPKYRPVARIAALVAALGLARVAVALGRRLPRYMRVALALLALWAVGRRITAGPAAFRLPRERRYWLAVETATRRYNLAQLFLFSAADTLVAAAPIRDMAARRQQYLDRLRPDVARDSPPAMPPLNVAVDFESSPHCGHFVQHRDRYAAAITTFLERLDSPV